MYKNLGEAFNAAKKTRQVQSKFIIWESGVSKSQFYRIINGKEAPSPETKARIAKSLNVNLSQFDELHYLSNSENKTDEYASSRKAISSPLYLVFAILMMGLTASIISNFRNNTEPKISPTVTSEEDGTLFIKDVTIPDGTSIPVNTTFVKTWRVKNTGKLVWKHRYLKRITPPTSLLCSSPMMVPIPETAPGETVDISVTFTTPHLPGSCRTDWKTADENGNLYFPDMHGLYSIINVVEK